MVGEIIGGGISGAFTTSQGCPMDMWLDDQSPSRVAMQPGTWEPSRRNLVGVGTVALPKLNSEDDVTLSRRSVGWHLVAVRELPWTVKRQQISLPEFLTRRIGASMPSFGTPSRHDWVLAAPAGLSPNTATRAMITDLSKFWGQF